MSIEKQPLPTGYTRNWLRRGNSETFEAVTRISISNHFDPSKFFSTVYDLNKQGISVKAIIH